MDEQKTSITELEKQFNRKSVEMKSIQQIGRALSSELRIERLLMLVIQEVNKLMDSERLIPGRLIQLRSLAGPPFPAA